MTPEEKRLLLKDLSARLSYGTIVSVTDGAIKYDAYIESISYRNIQVSPVSDSNFTENAFYKISEIKPYLRPMTSMTEEEVDEIDSMDFACWTTMINNDLRHRGPMSLLDAIITHHKMVKLIDWLNEHHIDYRGLIEKGLALEAPEGMYS